MVWVEDFFKGDWGAGVLGGLISKVRYTAKALRRRVFSL